MANAITTPTSRRYATPQQAAEYIGVTTRTIRSMIADGRINGYRASGRLVRVDLNEIDAAMKPYGGVSTQDGALTKVERAVNDALSAVPPPSDEQLRRVAALLGAAGAR